MAERHAFAQAALLARDGVPNGAVLPIWIDDRHFWYERTGHEGAEYRVVDATDGSFPLSVNRGRVARILATHLGTRLDPDTLILADLRFDLLARTLAFSAFGQSYRFDLASDALIKVAKADDANWLVSPAGDAALLLRSYNLWVRDLASGEERALTTNGTEYNSYGDVPAAMHGFRGRLGDSMPQAVWSPDGAWILTVQTDDRHVPDLPIIDFAPEPGARPHVRANRVSLPGDHRVTEFRILALHVATGRQSEARYARLPAVRMNSTPIGAGLCWWGLDSQTAYFVDIERGERRANLVEFDIATRTARTLFTEESETYVELGVNVYTPALIVPLPATQELVWYSERSGRGHLYLYDLATGSLRRAVTQGPWQVREILSVDPERREVFLLAGGLSEDDPYRVTPGIASLDTDGLRIVSAEAGDHKLWKAGEFNLLSKKLEGLDPDLISAVSPGGGQFVETVSTVTDPPRTVLRTREGRTIALLEAPAADLPHGWQAPEPVRCTAADGETDLYGLLFRPWGVSAEDSHPLIDLIYGGPQLSNVPHAHFALGTIEGQRYLDAVHLSALGSYVLILDGRGTANRERDFRTASHGAVHTASDLEDHVAAIRQLAAVHRIDLKRIGITGFSAGGYMSVHAALRFGDVFKVAVAGGGNYDQALFWHSWGERYQGLFKREHYIEQAARTHADGMTGKLLLIHGLRDEGCHPAGLFQLVQALIEEGKDPDLVLLPQGGHDWTGYGLRRRWDYFARHLIGSEPSVRRSFEREDDRVLRRAERNAALPVTRG